MCGVWYVDADVVIQIANKFTFWWDDLDSSLRNLVVVSPKLYTCSADAHSDCCTGLEIISLRMRSAALVGGVSSTLRAGGCTWVITFWFNKFLLLKPRILRVRLDTAESWKLKNTIAK